MSRVHDAARFVHTEARHHDGIASEFRIAVAASRYAHARASRAVYDPAVPPATAEETLASGGGLCGQACQVAADIARRLGVAARQIGFRFTRDDEEWTHVVCEFWIDGMWRLIDVQHLAYWEDVENGLLPLPLDAVRDLVRFERQKALVCDQVSLRFYADGHDPFAYLNADEVWVLTREDMQPDGDLLEVDA